MILDSPIISGSLTQQAGQTAEIPRYTAVSSSFLAASASFDARIDSIESTTASLSPRINALESFTASADATYVNVSGDSMTGGLTITGSLIVTDRITAQEFHTEYVSSSVVFQSGSTKFGDSGDDTHSFTGSVEIDGTIKASNLNGIFSSSAQITGSLGNYYIVSGTITQTTWDNIENKPAGIVSGSSQVVSLLPIGVVSGSSQITYSSISSIPVGIVSGAMQVTESLDVRYRLVGDDITFAELTFKPTLISGSSQLDGTTIQNLSGSFSGSFSGSYRGDGSQLTGLAAGAKFHTQSEPASTWTFVHNLSTQYPNVTVYGSNNNIILPQSITATNANTLVLEFGTPVSGYATAGIGGTIEVNGRTIKQYFTSSLSWRFEHNIGDRFVSIQTYDGNYEKIIPQTIALTDTTSSLITFPEATEGWAVGTIGGDLPAISSSYGGYVLQVSDSAPYTASWTPAADVLVTNAVNALTASHLNPISQSLIPAVSGAYDLGSQSNPWKHIYVGTGSIYLVDNTGTIVKTLTGDSIVTNDNLSSLNAFTASNFTTNIFTSSASARLNSIEIISASNIARIDSIETFTSSTSARLTSLEIKTGSLATTGSNVFIGTQTITGSLYITTDLIVQGSSSLQNITASAVSIGTNIVNLNTANPAVRYAGLSIGDSGSVGGSGSFLYDSVQDEMIFVHRGANTTVTSSVVLMGPQTYDSIGNETYPTLNIVQKGTGNEHLVDSCIFDNGTTTCIKNNLVGTGTACFASNVCAPTIVVNNTNPVLYINSGNNETATIGFTQGAVVGYGGFIKVSTGLGDRSMTFGLSAAGTNNDASTLVRLDDSGVTCFSNTICAPSIVSCNGSTFFQRGANVCNGLVISEQGGSITADKANIIRTAGGTSEHLFITPGINASTNACGYIRLGGDRNTCVGINAVPTDILHILGVDNGITICSAVANRPVLSFLNGANTMLKLSANATYGAIASCTGDLMYFYGSNIGIGQTTPAFGFEVYSTNQTAITSNNTFGANLNFIFNRDNTGGTRNCFNILTDQNAAYLRTLGSFPLVLSTNNQERLTIASNGISTFSCQVCVSQNLIITGEGMFINRPTASSGEPYIFWQKNGVNRGSIYGADNTAGLRYFADVNIFYGNVIPDANNTRCLGNSNCAWAHIYTNDLHLSNMNKCGGNDIDGTNGNWTIQEGAENLYIINNSNCKRFKIKLEEII
jgi:hypothetical protein